MSKRNKISLYTASETLAAWVEPGCTIWDAVRQAGVWQTGDCAGRGICGKCKARVEGDVSPLSEVELRHLSDIEIQRGIRLTCQCQVLGEARAYLPEIRIADCKAGLLLYEVFPGLLSAARTLKTHVPPMDRDKPLPLLERLQWAFKNHPCEISPANLNLLSKLDNGDGFYVTGGLIESSVIRALPEGQGSFYGLALDIGTTTLSGALVDLITGELMGVRDMPNSQMAYGRDILSRISYTVENPVGLALLQEKVGQDINALIADLIGDLEIMGEDILEMTVVGNPVMLHLFLGMDPRSLGRSPYMGLFRSGLVLRSGYMNFDINPGGRIFILPQIAGFLGADIVACLLAVEADDPGTMLLVDIGTNGEMVIKTDHGMMACSVAAGSAFEGAGITDGMIASSGAIDRFWLDNGKLCYSVVSQTKPRGICGSGLVDLLAVLLDMGAVDESGRIIPDKYPGQHYETSRGIQLIIVGAEDSANGMPIVFDQEDIRSLQLAKGAVRAGIEILLKEAGIPRDGIDEVLVAGAFGNFLNPAAIIRIGMLPDFPLNKIRNIGNAAARGAIAALLSEPERENADRLAKAVKAIELANRDDFTRVFIDSMNF